jgi:hypothetical protein
MIGKLVSFPVTGPISLTLWLARTIAEQAEAELYDEGKIRRELAELEMRSDLGEIGEEEYEQLEDNLMARLRESRKRAGM